MIFIPYIIPIVVNSFLYHIKVTNPKNKILRDIESQKVKIAPLKIKIEQEYKNKMFKLNNELKELEKLLENCRNKLYVY